MQSDPQPDLLHYAYHVMWSAQDDEFTATCAEFPSLSWLASSQTSALHGLQELLREIIGDMREQGEQVPQAATALALTSSCLASPCGHG